MGLGGQASGQNWREGKFRVGDDPGGARFLDTEAFFSIYSAWGLHFRIQLFTLELFPGGRQTRPQSTNAS